MARQHREHCALNTTSWRPRPKPVNALPLHRRAPPLKPLPNILSLLAPFPPPTYHSSLFPMSTMIYLESNRTRKHNNVLLMCVCHRKCCVNEKECAVRGPLTHLLAIVTGCQGELLPRHQVFFFFLTRILNSLSMRRTMVLITPRWRNRIGITHTLMGTLSAHVTIVMPHLSECFRRETFTENTSYIDQEGGKIYIVFSLASQRRNEWINKTIEHRLSHREHCIPMNT